MFLFIFKGTQKSELQLDICGMITLELGLYLQLITGRFARMFECKTGKWRRSLETW
jgi:hypothetical protein